MTTFLIATRNAHKVAEIRSVLGDDCEYLTLRDLPDAPGVIEDARTFAGNATKKAVTLAAWASRTRPDHPCLAGAKGPVYVVADDSGLEVDALNGAPGVHSARFAAVDAERETAGNSSDTENNTKLLRLLREVPEAARSARFRCVIALTPLIESPGSGEVSRQVSDELAGRTRLFEGACEGTIGQTAKGGGGFGYDPLFTPIGERQTFAELGEELKNRISHRARALQAMKASWA